MIAPEQVTVNDGKVSIKFPYPPPVEKDYIKEHLGARWDPVKKIWILKATRDALLYLSEQGALEAQDVPPTVEVGEDGPQPDRFDIPLFPYQRAGVKYLESLPNAIMGDEMGLGKTLQSLAAVRNHLPCLIVSPVIAKSVWSREIQKAMPWATFETLSGKPRELSGVDFTIINYDILKKWQTVLEAFPFSSLIADEAHYLKNLKAARTKSLLAIAASIPKRIMVTGTPILNRPIELYSLLAMLDLDREVEAGGFWRYVRNYCGGYINQFSGNWETKDASNLGELHEKVSPFVLRRLKKDVLKDLPEKRVTRLEWPLKKSELAEYNFCMKDFPGWYQIHHPELSPEEIARKPLGLMQLGALRRLSCEAKMEEVVELLSESFVPEGKKAVIFAEYRDTVSSLHKTFAENSVMIIGGQSQKERESAEKRFQEDPDILFCFASTKAAGVALTLTAADTAIFLTVPWTPGDFAQASDRIHRIGQKNAVEIMVPVATEIDQVLWEVIASKERIVGSVIDGGMEAATIAASQNGSMEEVAKRMGIKLTKGEKGEVNEVE